MKGVIVTCLESLVKEQFGQHSWENVLEEAGLDKHTLFNMTSNVEDTSVLDIIHAACKVLNLTPDQAAECLRRLLGQCVCAESVQYVLSKKSAFCQRNAAPYG